MEGNDNQQITKRNGLANLVHWIVHTLYSLSSAAAAGKERCLDEDEWSRAASAAISSQQV